jgi:hypothetical protein
MLARLDEIEADLLARRERAQAEGWRGEIEGLDLTLSFLRNKRAHTQRFTRRVQLGLPTCTSRQPGKELRDRTRPPGRSSCLRRRALPG